MTERHFLNKDPGKISREQQDAFIKLTNLSSSDKDTGKNISKIIGLGGVGADKSDTEGEILFLTLLTFSTEKERKFSQSSFEVTKTD